jgi:hypothetical protein
VRRSLISFRIVLMFTTIFLGACAEHNTYRVYDGYYHDYHNWDAHEESYYVGWEKETHRDHRDFKKRNADEQSDYWKWRHSHLDKDKDHDNR